MGRDDTRRAQAARRAALTRFTHFAAIDWSGAVGERQRGIAVAICSLGTAAPVPVRPGHVWSRSEVAEWLLDEMPAGTLVGLDLGLSLPFADRGAFFPGWTDTPADARALWALVERLCAGDPHLAAASFVDHGEASRHFRRHGGRTGDRFGTGRGRLRVTEEAQRAAGLNPYSNLNLVGAAQVGKSSLTGMRVLHRVDGQLPIWPFDPDVAGGRTKNRSKLRTFAELNDALAAIGSASVAGAGPIDDHRSDALLAAAWLRTVATRADLWRPAALTPTIARTEGWTFGIP